MTAYIRVPFLETVRDATGGNPKVQRKEYLPEGPVPVLDQGQDFIAGYTGTENAYAGQLPVVLFGDHTRTFKYVDFSFALGADGVKVLVPQEGFEALFLYYYFLNAHIPNAGYSRHFKFLRELLVCKPPLSEQRRIVGILNRAAKIERLRAQAQERLREFIPALFIKMFGDPVENPMGWKIKQLGDLIQGFQGGKNLKAGGSASNFRILKVSAVTGGVFDPFMSKPAPEGYVAPSDHLVRVGDLLISRANTTALVGATAMVEHDVPRVLLPDKIWRFVWYKNSEVDPIYLHAFLQASSTRHVLSALATGTSGSMKNISQTKLKTLPVLLPPSEIQHCFTKIVKAVASASTLSKSSSTIGSTLSTSLMSRLLEDNA